MAYNGYYIGRPSSGSGASPYVMAAAYGFSVADYYVTPAAAAQGSATMSVVLLPRMVDLRNGGVHYLFGNYDGFGNGGYAVFRNNDRLQFFVTDGGGNILQAFTGADWPNPGGTSDFASGTTLHIVFTFDGTTARLYVSGRQQQSVAGGDGAYLAPTPAQGCGWGVDLYTATAGPFDGAFAGVAYHGGLVMSPTQVFDHYRACVTAGYLVDGGVGFENLWSLQSEAVGAAPATITDAGSLGQDTTLTGALTIERERPEFLQVGGA